MIFRAELVDGIDERTEIVGVDVGGDAVTEVEHVAGAVAVALENVGDTLANDLW